MRWRQAIVLGTMLVAARGSVAGAQSKLMPYFGGGVLVPLGGFGDYANTGWLALAGVSIPTSNEKVSVNVTAMYGHADHDGPFSEATNIPGVLADISYAVPIGSATGFVGVGGGVIQHRYDPGDLPYNTESQTKAVGALSGGLDWRFGNKMAFWVDGHLLLASSTSFFGLSAGLMFNLPHGSKFHVPILGR